MQQSNDAFWKALAAGLRARGIADIPERLNRQLPYGVDWNDSCLFTQTCGYPIFSTSFGQFSIVGTPWYDVPGCAGPLHSSFIVVRDDATIVDVSELRGLTFAINEPDSNSGMNLPRRLFAPHNRNGRFFARVDISGSHEASAAFVASGRAHAAAIDCVTFAFLGRYRPALASRLRIIAQTPASPAPPLVTSKAMPAETVQHLRDTLIDILQDPGHTALCESLFLSSVTDADESSYEIVLTYERESVALGYPVLA